jgi:hypothetical protein
MMTGNIPKLKKDMNIQAQKAHKTPIRFLSLNCFQREPLLRASLWTKQLHGKLRAGWQALPRTLDRSQLASVLFYTLRQKKLAQKWAGWGQGSEWTSFSPVGHHTAFLTECMVANTSNPEENCGQVDWLKNPTPSLSLLGWGWEVEATWIYYKWCYLWGLLTTKPSAWTQIHLTPMKIFS